MGSNTGYQKHIWETTNYQKYLWRTPIFRNIYGEHDQLSEISIGSTSHIQKYIYGEHNELSEISTESTSDYQKYLWKALLIFRNIYGEPYQ